jgi:hypothetical protein
VAGCLFAGWIGYLAYLVSITRNPVTLSRPQFLVANLYVLAELGPAQKDDKNPSDKVLIRKVYWSEKPSDGLVGTEFAVENLDRCEMRNGWIGTGLYIVPLTKTSDGKYKLTEIPISPGFHHDKTTFNYLRIYPDTEQAQEQVEYLIKKFHD